MTVGFMTAIFSIASITKQLAIAWKFGRSDDLDAFLVALLVPSLLVNIVGNSFNSAFIPTYINVKENQGHAESQKLFSSVTAWSSLLLILTAIVTVTTAPFYIPLLARGFDSEKLRLTLNLLYSVSPIIVLSGTITIWSAVLNAGEHFAFAALTPTITPILSVVLLLFTSLEVYALSIALVTGSIFEIIALGLALQRQGISIVPKFYHFDSYLNQVASQYVPMVAGAFLLSSTELVDKSMAAMLGSGSVAALEYGSRIIALPLSLATKALSVAVLPYFSQMVAQKDWVSVISTIKKYLLLIFLITVPLTALLAFFSRETIEVVFQRGAFNSDDTLVVSQVNLYYSLQIPFYIGGVFLVRLISAFQANHVLMWSALISLFLNIAGNIIFVQILGTAGIALSTSLVYCIAFFFIAYCVIKKIKKYGNI